MKDLNTNTMITYDILSGKLYTDLNTPYDVEGNKIDVYTSVRWSSENSEDYKRKEKIIDDYVIDHKNFLLSAWCDFSGYEYWVIQQEEKNYVSIDVCLKKQPNEYSQEEIMEISRFIIDADNFFQKHLL